MKRVCTLLFAIACFSLCYSQSNNLQYYTSQARDAYKAGNYQKFYEMIQKAHQLHPYHQGILYQAGIASALNNKPDEAIQYLSEAVRINADYNLNSDDLKSLTEREDFQKLKALQTDLQTKIIHSDTAFVIKDRSLHIESITAGETKDVFYVGSIHKRKIVRVDSRGATNDFTTSAQNGLCAVFGVKVDARKKVLWACSSPIEVMEHFDSTAASAVYKYDLKTKKLLTKYTPEESGDFVFGDIVLDPQGNVFVSDSKQNIIFTVNEQNGKLERYFTSPEFWSLQGLAFSENGRYLFAADYIKGIYRLDTKHKSLKLLSHDFKQTLKSIDGLVFHKNSLIAIQNLVYPMRVTQYTLNGAMDKLTDFAIIDRGHPAFNEPTNGCVLNNEFYYVANSLWSGYDQQHQLKPEEQLQDAVILKMDLRKLK